MDRLRKILVGVDYSECARSALAQAVRMARWNNARLDVVHVVEYLVISELAERFGYSQEQIQQETVRDAAHRLRQWLDELQAPAERAVSVATGAPVDVLLKKVRETSADLLVLGVRGSSLIPFGAGTLATKCLRKAPTKVMLVTEGHARPFRTVVACVDFSEMSREAVTQAVRVASQDGSEIHFLHVSEALRTRHPYLPGPISGAVPQQKGPYPEVLEQRLKKFAGDLPELAVRFVVFESTSHGHGIAEYAREAQADLVILGTKGRTNLEYVLLGSTVERLLRELPCSVLRVGAVTGVRPSG